MAGHEEPGKSKVGDTPADARAFEARMGLPARSVRPGEEFIRFTARAAANVTPPPVDEPAVHEEVEPRRRHPEHILGPDFLPD